jgi:hypothetical protein
MRRRDPFLRAPLPLLRLHLLAAVCVLACTGGWHREPHAYRMPPANAGPERYAAWFADSDGRVLYFGLSPFWSLWWSRGGDPLADLETPGDHLIGRFDLARRAFLPPLRVHTAASGARGSVWDVLVHSNGWIYYTAFTEGMGRVDPRTGAVERFAAAGEGLNELAEGPEGLVFATRYAGAPHPDTNVRRGGSLVVLEPEGTVLREVFLPGPVDGIAAAKSVAVDPGSGAAWVNADLLHDDGRLGYAAYHIASDGRIVEVRPAPPELLFARFDGRGRLFRIDDESGRIVLRVERRGRLLARLDLGLRPALDFAQDIHFAHDGTAVIAFWSGRVEVVSFDEERGIGRRSIRMRFPRDCRPPRGRGVVYSAVLHGGNVWATLTCGATVLREPVGTVDAATPAGADPRVSAPPRRGPVAAGSGAAVS